MYKFTRFIGACFAGVLAASAGATTVGLVLPNAGIPVGSTFSVVLQVSGLRGNSADTLGLFDIDLGFDRTRLLLDEVSFGTHLDAQGLGSIQDAVVGIGTVNLFEQSLDPASVLQALQPDTFALATLTFLAVGAGPASFQLRVNSFLNANSDPLIFSISPPGSVVIAAIPEPASAWAFSLGLLALAYRRRLPLQFGTAN